MRERPWIYLLRLCTVVHSLTRSSNALRQHVACNTCRTSPQHPTLRPRRVDTCCVQYLCTGQHDNIARSRAGIASILRRHVQAIARKTMLHQRAQRTRRSNFPPVFRDGAPPTPRSARQTPTRRP
ncbi:hypothetical protein ACQKWADRAFT_205173 [Trichoderma austrokoningii]